MHLPGMMCNAPLLVIERGRWGSWVGVLGEAWLYRSALVGDPWRVGAAIWGFPGQACKPGLGWDNAPHCIAACGQCPTCCTSIGAPQHAGHAHARVHVGQHWGKHLRPRPVTAGLCIQKSGVHYCCTRAPAAATTGMHEYPRSHCSWPRDQSHCVVGRSLVPEPACPGKQTEEHAKQ